MTMKLVQVVFGTLWLLQSGRLLTYCKRHCIPFIMPLYDSMYIKRYPQGMGN